MTTDAVRTQPDAYTTLLEDAELELAIEELSAFILGRAQGLAEQLGFGWRPCPDAPARYDVLQQAFAHSERTGDPLPVSDEHSSSVIYTDAAVNFAMRFWHDVSHVRSGLSFQLVDELELAHVQLDELVQAGFPHGGLVWKLLYADLAGQSYLLAVSGRFPADQRSFALRCLQLGLDRGIIATARAERPQ